MDFIQQTLWRIQTDPRDVLLQNPLATGGAVAASLLAALFLLKTSTSVPSRQKQRLNTELDKKTLSEAEEFVKSSECKKSSAIWTVGVSRGGVSVAQVGTLRYFLLTAETPAAQDILNCVLMAAYSPEEMTGRAKPLLILFMETRVSTPAVIAQAQALLRKFDIDSKVKESIKDDEFVELQKLQVHQPTPNDNVLHLDYLPTPTRVCYMCREQITEKKPSQCSACKSIIYCGIVCAKDNWANHKPICPMFKSAVLSIEKYDLHAFPFTFYSKTVPLQLYNKVIFLMKEKILDIGLFKRLSQNSCDVPFGVLSVELNKLLEQAKDAISYSALSGLPTQIYPLSLPFKDGTKLTNIDCWKSFFEAKDIPFSSPAAIVLHYPLTVFHLLNKYTFPQGLSSRKLVIHLVGVEEELDYLVAFQILMALLPDVEIIIRMIGPSIPEEFISITKSFSFKAHSGPGSLLITFHRSVYSPNHYSGEEFVTKSNVAAKPDIVVAMNASLMAHQTWVDTVRFFVENNHKMFFTEAMEPQAEIAKKNFGNINASFSVPITPNPFRQPINLWTPDTNLPGWSNGFLFGIN